jgi:hypothetical protein
MTFIIPSRTIGFWAYKSACRITRSQHRVHDFCGCAWVRLSRECHP